jgi:L-histidine Nalpha-methyltransferase
VDTSEELLHLAVRGLVHRMHLSTDRVMSLPWDFARTESLIALRRLLDEMFGGTPVLFSSLGNTIAQFDDDTGVLSAIVAELLRPGDRLLLEVEATSALGDGLASAAAREHAHSPAFTRFVTSALRHNSDLDVDLGCVEALGEVEDTRALVVKTVYRAAEDVVLTLPNQATVGFVHDDTIRLALSRKYTAEGLAAMVAEAGLTVVGDQITGTGGPFGLALLMLELD